MINIMLMKVIIKIVLEIITVTVVTIINSNNKSNKGSNNDKKVVVKKLVRPIRNSFIYCFPYFSFCLEIIF